MSSDFSVVVSGRGLGSVGCCHWPSDGRVFPPAPASDAQHQEITDDIAVTRNFAIPIDVFR